MLQYYTQLHSKNHVIIITRSAVNGVRNFVYMSDLNILIISGITTKSLHLHDPRKDKKYNLIRKQLSQRRTFSPRLRSWPAYSHRQTRQTVNCQTVERSLIETFRVRSYSRLQPKMLRCHLEFAVHCWHCRSKQKPRHKKERLLLYEVVNNYPKSQNKAKKHY